MSWRYIITLSKPLIPKQTLQKLNHWYNKKYSLLLLLWTLSLFPLILLLPHLPFLLMPLLVGTVRTFPLRFLLLSLWVYLGYDNWVAHTLMEALLDLKLPILAQYFFDLEFFLPFNFILHHHSCLFLLFNLFFFYLSLILLRFFCLNFSTNLLFLDIVNLLILNFITKTFL